MPVGRISGHVSVLIRFGPHSWHYSRRTVAFAAARPQPPASLVCPCIEQLRIFKTAAIFECHGQKFMARRSAQVSPSCVFGSMSLGGLNCLLFGVC